MSDPRGNQEPEIDEELPPDEEGDEVEPVPEIEGEEEPDIEGEEPEPAPIAVRGPPNKRQSEIIKLRQRAQEAEVRAARAEGEAQARRNQPDPVVAARQAAEEAEEAQLVARMSPAEKAQYVLAKEVRDTRNGQHRLEARLADSADESRFIARYGNDPRFKEYMGDVEDRVAQFRNQGMAFQREAILKFLIGERAMSAPAKKGATVQRRAASERMGAARGGNTGAARSNVRSGPSRGGSMISQMERSDGAV